MQNSNRNCSYKAESRRQLEKRTTWKHFWIEFKRKIISTKIEKPAAKTPFATLQMETIAQRQQRHKKKSPGSLNSNGNAVRHKFDGKATMPETVALQFFALHNGTSVCPKKHNVSCKSWRSNRIHDVAVPIPIPSTNSDLQNCNQNRKTVLHRCALAYDGLRGFLKGLMEVNLKLC